MDAEIQKKLREKFETAQIGLKPKITCRDCSKEFSKECSKHPKKRCDSLRGEPGCGQWITPAHMHIEFVGHANVTDRLLTVDPEWTWEPVAFAPNGLPALTPDGGLWIRLTVAGVTRVGYGGADGKQGDDAVKEAVSDAIKTTAMRFGVGLDLWRKEEPSGLSHEPGSAPVGRGEQPRNGTGRPPQQPATPPAAAPAPTTADEARALLKAACADNKWDLGIVATRFKAVGNGDLKTTDDAAAIVKFRDGLFSVSDSELRKQPAANGAQR